MKVAVVHVEVGVKEASSGSWWALVETRQLGLAAAAEPVQVPAAVVADDNDDLFGRANMPMTAPDTVDSTVRVHTVMDNVGVQENTILVQ